MTLATPIALPSLSAQPRGRARLTPLLTILLFLPFLACAGVYAYCKIFTTFMAYDDEGYMMISLANFQKGLPLYDQVFSQYGPFFYWSSWFVYKICHLHLDHTSVRAIVLLLWLTCSLMLAGFAHRLTRSRALAILVFVASFLHMSVMANEPGHPQALCAFLTLSALLLTPFLTPFSAHDLAPRTSAMMARLAKYHIIPLLLGALTAALALTKTNLGVFLFLSVALLLVCLATPPAGSRRTTILKIFLSMAILILPTALMRLHLHDPTAIWAHTYRLVATLAALPVLTLAFLPFTRIPAASNPKQPALRFNAVVWYLVSCLSVAIFFAIITILRGTSLYGLAYGLVLMHIQFAAIFYVPAPIPDFCHVYPLASIATFAVFLLLRRLSTTLSEVLAFLLKIAFGVTAFTLALLPYLHNLFPALDRILRPLAPLGAYHHAGLLLGIVAPFLWVAMLPRKNQSPFLAVSRLALVLIALLQMLMAYPVGGSQMAFATLLLLPAGALAIADAFSSLAGLAAPFPIARLAGLGMAYMMSIATVLIAAGLSYLGTAKIYAYYASRPSINIPGARSIHLDEPNCAAFQWATYNIRQADTLFTFTGQNSFHFFTGVPSPTTFNVTMWPTQLTLDQQRTIVQSLSAPTLHPMILQSADLTENRPQYDAYPLVDYIKHTMVARGSVLAFTLRTRPDWNPDLTFSAFLQPAPPEPTPDHVNPDVHITLVIPAMPHRQAQTLLLCDLFKPGDLASSLCVGDHSLTVLDEAGKPIPLYATPIDLSTPRRLTLITHAPNVWNDLEHAGFGVVRLFNTKSEPVASIPFVRH